MKKNDLIERFKTEVLVTGPESSLPCNLSDEWLDILLGQANEFSEAEELVKEGENVRVTEIMAAVIHILMAKNGFKEVSIEESKLFSCIEQYTLELSLEEISRKTEFNINAATIENIFTNRNADFSHR
ncbi:hypothetical protein [uncultured Pseudoalteromonas sp.]|uniref:hypothetical protein n=1 Tax=uncultured Pseudoalteromonas sp. TaxID=114053 RepID=UPI002593A60D|nr:hypothetical protein [uncultured Pseudoalteromonas sp.]